VKWCMGKVSNYVVLTEKQSWLSARFSYSIMDVWGLILCLQKDDGSDSFAVQLADETHWNDLVIIIAVVCDLYLTCALLIFPLMRSI